VVAVWALFAGIALLIHARSRGWRAALIGILAIIASLFLFFHPARGAQAILWLVGICAIIACALAIWQGWEEKRALYTPLEPAP
jgi:uncharacterized membrane protein HdeD (DUF308 family)